MVAILLFFVALLSFASGDGDPVRITVRPQQVYIEHGTANQLLNFDFLLENRTKDKLRIDSIRVSVFDARDKLMIRQVVDQHGLSPSIYTIPKLELDAKSSLYLFNPFYSFEPDLKFTTLKYEFVFSTEDGQIQYQSNVSVRPVNYETKTSLVLPLRGRIIVAAGHDFYAPHRRIDLTHPVARLVGLKANSARYAYDLAVINENGDLYRDKGKRLEDWLGYAAPIYSPGSGKILTLVDGIPDNTFGDRGVIFSPLLSMETPSGIFGNYIVIDHGNGEFSLFAHLKQGSFKVIRGEVVRRGQMIGRIGFSGNTDFVHTHYQLQDGADPGTSEGLPSYFNNFRRVLGSRMRRVARGQIDTGNIIEAP
jgi:hypothetical protein